MRQISMGLTILCIRNEPLLGMVLKHHQPKLISPEGRKDVYFVLDQGSLRRQQVGQVVPCIEAATNEL